uniref:Uncharacterized protein n=1 Tax=mine drainage metagenome TaxID=410659 RepID=E6PTF2_9ZZZZ
MKSKPAKTSPKPAPKPNKVVGINKSVRVSKLASNPLDKFMAELANIDQPRLKMPKGGMTRVVADDSAANDDNNLDDPVVFSPEGAKAFLAYVERYGFDTLPRTFGEASGMVVFCDDLNQICYPFALDAEGLAICQRIALETSEKWYPRQVEAARMYLAGEFEKLKARHGGPGILPFCSQVYREYLDE